MVLRTIWLIAIEDLRLRLTLTLCGSATLSLEKPPDASGDPALEAEGIEPARLGVRNDFNAAVVQRLPDAQIEIDFQAGLLVVKLMRQPDT
jgi:hypothetical protein